MTGPAIALTLMLLQGAGPRASAKDSSSGTRVTKPAPVRNSNGLSCVGGQIYFIDGHYYRVVRGAWVECSPDLPPAV